MRGCATGIIAWEGGCGEDIKTVAEGNGGRRAQSLVCQRRLVSVLVGRLGSGGGMYVFMHARYAYY